MDNQKPSRPDDQLVRDPVCGMVKPRSQMRAKTVYRGQTYYFCWKGDKEMFLQNPKHWLTRTTATRDRG